ncbi:hypothetical protein EVA_21918, partial [gut metagenome]
DKIQYGTAYNPLLTIITAKMIPITGQVLEYDCNVA